ncbi:DUF4974 domain-containing protein [Chitinophaga sp. SYP-B3965]|uniref:FecR family protein n=1 Tax=Chitinophaga sp. SYP-B3965 TaxID=2663120 RepID=UPI00129960D4|nr:FecR family protein [Chitinophaga sp. SYP-B3965]MRG45465.1 DUF4974 domain-containing protein [Chitinophaga sp. SYP-B3965]
MDNNAIKKLIDQYLKGQLSAQEAKQVEQLLERMADEQAFETLPEEEREEARQGGYERLLTRIQAAEQPAPVRKLKRLKIAATVALFIIAGTLYRNNLLNLVAPHRLTDVTSAKGKIRKLILSDGSIVWLKDSSKLIFPVTFGKGSRVVTLEGEALFEVAKDAEHPFYIHCGPLTTQVLGTSFNIRSNGQQTEVTVLTGKISLSSAKAGRIMVYPNEKAVYAVSSETIAKDHKAVHPLHELTRGTEYDMAFNDANMQEVIKRIENKFDIQILLKDTTINHNLITADLTDQSLENTMKMIGQALNLEVLMEGKTISLQQQTRHN